MAKFRRRVLTDKNATFVTFFFFLVYLVVNRGAEYKKRDRLNRSLSGCPVGFFRCRSSDFVDDEPGSHPTGHKKRKPFDFLFWVPSRIRTDDIQNHNLTL